MEQDRSLLARDVDMMDEMLTSNSPPAIQQRIQAGRIGWAGLLALTTARTGLILLVQAVVAAAFLIHGDLSPWRAQAPWWTVYATLVDIGCLLLLWRQAREEGIRLGDLFGIDRSRLGREVLWGLLYFVVLFPIVAGFGSMAGFPASDQAVLTRPDFQRAFIALIQEGLRAGPRGAQVDTALMASPWDFRPQDIRMAVQLWHGEADANAPLAMGHYMAATIPNSHAYYYPGEGHLSLMAKYIDEILNVLAA